MSGSTKARRATGPRTASGKAKCAKNALKHGLTADRLLLAGESAKELRAFRRALFDELAPQGPIQRILTSRVVSLAWRLRRAERAERDALEAAEHEVHAEDADRPARLERLTRLVEQAIPHAASRSNEAALALAAAFSSDTRLGRAMIRADATDALARISRYEGGLWRGFREALRELRVEQARGVQVGSPAE